MCLDLDAKHVCCDSLLHVRSLLDLENPGYQLPCLCTNTDIMSSHDPENALGFCILIETLTIELLEIIELKDTELSAWLIVSRDMFVPASRVFSHISTQYGLTVCL